MKKTQKIILLCLASTALLGMSALALRAYLHKPSTDQVDTLQAYIDSKRTSAKQNKDSAQFHYNEYEKLTDMPVDSAFRDSLFARIEREAKADSIRRGLNR